MGLAIYEKHGWRLPGWKELLQFSSVQFSLFKKTLNRYRPSFVFTGVDDDPDDDEDSMMGDDDTSSQSHLHLVSVYSNPHRNRHC